MQIFFQADNWMNMMEPMAAEVPYMTSVGNHEEYFNFTHYEGRYKSQTPDGNPFFYRFFLNLDIIIMFKKWQIIYGKFYLSFQL